MATINGVSFEFEELSIVAEQRNVVSPQPGSDTNFITGMGYKGLVLRLSGHESTLALYDAVISEFMKEGEQTLVHRTDWQFKVYSATLMPVLLAGIPENYFPYELILLTTTPYRESTTETTRTKTITTNNQEWTQDNSANDIDTDGSVDALPDIQITGGAVGSGFNRASGRGAEDTDATVYTNTTYTYVLKKTYTYTADANAAWILHTCGLDIRHYDADTVWGKVTYQAASLNAGAETDVPSGEWSTTSATYVSKTVSPEIQCANNETLTVRFYNKVSTQPGNTCYITNLVSTITATRKDVCTDPEIYNTADTTVKCDVAGEIEPDEIVRINADGTGTHEYDDDFSTTKYLDAVWDILYGTHTPLSYGLDVSGAASMTASNESDGAVINLIDNNTGSIWGATGTTAGQWAKFDFGAGNVKKVRKLRIYTLIGLSFKNFIFAGSNNNIDWTSILTDIATSSAGWQDFTFSNDINYRYYRLYAIDGYNATILYVGEAELMENEPYIAIADDGYLCYKRESNGPITGIPTLTSQINITSGIPTIKISEDASTWYDITTAIVDDVDTIYELDSSSLSLKGLTEFYWRYDCVKAAAATCSIKSFELDVNIVTIDFENPKITGSGTSTFRCDQDTNSGLNCDVSLIYSDRSWPI